MNSSNASVGRSEFRTLLQGQADTLLQWTQSGHWRTTATNVAVILLGAGAYGAAMGWWRDPLQGLYTAIKFPLILLLVAFGNALLNAMLAPLLGLDIGFRRSLLAVLMSFTLLAAILGAFSPLAAFLVWNAPPMNPDYEISGGTYSFIQLTHVGVIGFAGVAANVRLFQLLVRLGGSVAVARRVLFAWLCGNLFLGSQLTWMLRPFIGTPALSLQFFREEAMKGNFYETVLRSLSRLVQFD